MSTHNPVLYLTKHSLLDTRDKRHLMIWNELPVWLIVDDELLAFLRCIDGKRTTVEVIQLHAQRTGEEPTRIARDVQPVIQQLIQRGIVSTTPEFPAPAKEAVEIANITFNITNRCNLHCPFCYNERREVTEIDISAFASALRKDQANWSQHCSFIILGGEPLLNPNRLFALLERTDGMFGRPAMFSTNGTLLTPEIARSLARQRVEVQVSLDAPFAEQHDSLRGRGTFQKAIDGISYLIDEGVYTIISMVYARGREDHLGPYMELAQRLGVSEARFIPLRAVGAGCGNRSQLPDQYLFFCTLQRLLASHPEYRRYLKRDFFSIAFAKCAVSTPTESCGVGRQVIFVDADGSVYPCPNHVHPEFIAGNVVDMPLSKILETTSVFRTMRSRFHVDRYTMCSTCAYKRWCAGDCRAEVVDCTSDPRASSPHCAALRKVFKEVLWTLGEENIAFDAQESAANWC